MHDAHRGLGAEEEGREASGYGPEHSCSRAAWSARTSARAVSWSTPFTANRTLRQSRGLRTRDEEEAKGAEEEAEGAEEEAERAAAEEDEGEEEGCFFWR